MFRILFADYDNTALSADHLTISTHRLDGRTDLHNGEMWPIEISGASLLRRQLNRIWPTTYR